MSLWPGRHQCLRCPLDPSTQVRVYSGEHGVGPFTHLLLRIAEMYGNICDEVILLTGLATQDLPKPVGLHEIFISDGNLLRQDCARPCLMLLAGPDGSKVQGSETRRIVRVGTIIAINGHEAVALVGVKCAERAIDGNLLVI